MITSGLSNNGILGKTDVNAKIFNKNTITIDMFGNAFYRQFDYKLVTHARVFSLMPKFKMSEKQGLFLANSLYYLRKKYSFDNMCLWEKIKTDTILLPLSNDKIDFDFMENFIAEIEGHRVAMLTAYLKGSELDDYELSSGESNALSQFNNIVWKERKMEDLFVKVKTNKLPYKAKELPCIPNEMYNLPCLTSSFRNQGLNYFAPRNGATVLKNVISIPSNSDVYRAYYQSRDFTVLSDAYAIKWKSISNTLSPNQYLFIVMCINKVTDLKIYSHKNKLGGWEVLKNKYIMLPHNNKDEIDFKFMELYISAVKKLAVKDVVLYADDKISTTNK